MIRFYFEDFKINLVCVMDRTLFLQNLYIEVLTLKVTVFIFLFSFIVFFHYHLSPLSLPPKVIYLKVRSLGR